MTVEEILPRTMVLIPAFNEAKNLPTIIPAIRRELPGAEITVIDDGSSDETAQCVLAADIHLLRLPCNLGIGSAMKTGFVDALERGAQFVLRIDGDGQHPPAEARKLFEEMAKKPNDLIIGTRFGSENHYECGWGHRMALRQLSWFVSLICAKRATDPTSGFWLVSRPLLRCFASIYPNDYPEPEALALLRRQGFDWTEVSVNFNRRRFGKSSLNVWKSLLFAAKVYLALFVDRLRVVNQLDSSRHIKTKENA